MSEWQQNLLVVELGVIDELNLEDFVPDLTDCGHAPALMLIVSFHGVYLVPNLQLMSPLLFLLLLQLKMKVRENIILRWKLNSLKFGRNIID